MAKKSSAQVSNLSPVEPGAITPPAAVSNALALFAPATAIEGLTEGLTRRNMPQMLLPKDVPIGAAIDAEIIDAVSSPATTVKGKCLWLKSNANGQEFLFPVTGVVRQALIGGYDGDKDKDGEKLIALLKKEIGNRFVAKRCPGRDSTKFKKEMYVFEVFTGKMPAKAK
jgi:hypothetical protein